jgi:prepilin-type N-terminal cleavage/methylation domain-containing protein
VTRPAQPGNQGFVLIEILVALSVIAVMAGLMAGVFGQLRSVANLREQITAKSELAGAASHLERTFAAAKKAPLPGQEEDERKMFDGKPTEVRFAAVTRQGFYSLALRDIRIYVDRQTSPPRLVETLTLRRPGEPADESKVNVVILENFDTITFTYSGDGTSFASVWNSDETLPKLVKVTIGRSISGKRVTATALARIL